MIPKVKLYSMFIFCFVFLGCTTKFNESAIDKDFKVVHLNPLTDQEIEIQNPIYYCHGNNIYALNQKGFKLTRFRVESDKTWKKDTFIQLPEGKGPGEFVAPGSLCVDNNNKVIITDSALSRVTVFDNNFKLEDISYIDYEGSIVTGDGMVDCTEDNLLILSYIHYVEPKKELLYFDYDKGEIVKLFGRDVVVKPNNLESFISAVGNYYYIDGNIFRMTFEPGLYIYGKSGKVISIDLNRSLKRYGIHLVRPGAGNDKLSIKGKKGVQEYGLIRYLDGKGVFFSIADYHNNRILLLKIGKDLSLIHISEPTRPY